MSRNRLVGLIAGAVVLIAVIVGGIYAYQRKAAPPAPSEPAPTAEQKQQPGKPESAPAPSQQSEAKKTETPKPAEKQKPTSVPSFDVVRVEQSGEGVIAGRAEPGWTVKLESGGSKVAETIVDEEGAWMVVLEKALPAGSHTLTLRAISPDGSKALTAQQGVQVAVGPAPSEPQMAGKETPPESEEASPGATPPAAPPAPEKAPDVAASEPEIAPEAVPAPPIRPSERPKPAVRIKKVDYVDVSSDSGKITISGIGDPNATISVFFNDAPVGEVVIGADGNWSYVVEKRLIDGDNVVRVDKLDPAGGMIGGRASVTLRRAPEVAAREPAPAAPSAETPPPAAEQPKPEVAAREAAPAAPSAEAPPPSEKPKPEIAAPEAAPTSVPGAGAPVDLSSQPQPMYPEEKTEDVAAGPRPGEAETVPETSTDVAKAEPEAPTLPLPPVYPGTEPASSARTSYPVVAVPPVDLSSQPQPVYPSAEADSADAEPQSSDVASEAQPDDAKPDSSGAAAESKPEASTEIAKTEPEAPVVPLQPVYPSGPPETPSRPPFPIVTVPPDDLSSQPQPVYPKREEPAPEVAASEPSGPDTAVTVEEPSPSASSPPSVAAPSAEPPSLASQPQPVVPKEEPQPEAKPEPSAPVAAAEPPAAPAPSKPAAPPAAEETPESPKAPDVAAASPTIVTAETPGAKKPEAELPKVVFNSLDYAEAEGETGSMALTGTGDPGARIHLFLNNHPLGETTVAQDGSWSFETSRKLHPGQHNIRADQLEAGGTVVASASIGMERVEKPVPPEEPVAAQQPSAAPAPTAPSPPAKDAETAAAEAEKPATEEPKPRRIHSRNYTVQRGDTLWDIAEDFYGGGWRFKAIVRGNRNKIRNPHLIYPEQQFRMPDKP